jgi:PilZ domain
MIQFRGCYVKYGETAALKSFVPGWGQFHNQHYLKGAVFQGLFVLTALSVLYLAMVQVEIGVATGRARALLILGLLIIWEVALFDSYHFAIENRRRDAKRINVAVSTFVSGLALNGENFEEVAVIQNLSKFGTCLFLSKKVGVGTELDLEFEGNVRSRGRVVWQKEGSHFQNLVGVELLTPLKESFLLGMANPSTSSSAQSTPQQGSHPRSGFQEIINAPQND